MNLFRILMSLVALFLVVVVFALGALYFFIDPNKLKPLIITAVKKQTGYQIAIPNPLRWTFYPALSIKTDNIFLTAPNARGSFAHLRHIKFTLPLDFFLRKKQTFKGEIFISSIAMGKLNLDDAHVAIKWHDHTLELSNINAELFAGSLSAYVIGQQLPISPQWDWRVRLDNVDVQPLFEALADADTQVNLTGRGSLQLSASSMGKDIPTILEHMNGVGTFKCVQGAVKGIDLNYLVNTADALLSNKTITAHAEFNNASAETTFESFTGNTLIRNGVATTDNLNLATNTFITKGTGSLNIPARTIDLQLQIHPQKHLAAKWAIPVLVTGDVTKPDVRLDRDAVEKWLASQDMEKVKAKIEEKVNELLPKANEFLQKILR